MGCARTRKWLLPSFLLALAAFHNVAALAMPDPCLHENYKNLTDVHRSVSYETAYPEPPLCDIDLVAGWYRFVVDAESKMPETCVDRLKCGTTVPIWLNGTHPSVSDGIQTKQACANVQTGGFFYVTCCGQWINIGVKNCGSFFIYYLHPTPACPMAYCAGKDVPCPAGKWSPTGFPPDCKEHYPQLTDPPSFRGPVIEQNIFYFTCDLTFSGNDPDQAFEFAWLFNGVEDPKVPPEIVSDPGRSARLDGAKLAGLLNKNVGCKVRAFYKQNIIKKGPWLESARTYWAGIQTDPTHIYIHTDEDKHDVVIRSTLPVLCNSSVADDACCLYIWLSVSGSAEDQAYAVVTSDCRYSLCKSHWNNTRQEVSRTVSVVARKTPMKYGTKDLLVSFANITVADASPYQQLFQGFKIPSVQVDLEQRDSKLCQIVTDPHIIGLENKRVFHLFRVGDYTAYENVQRDFEVQIRTWPCFKELRHRAVTCICGVAVREKDDLIRVNGCNNSFYGESVGSPEITVPRPLREGTTILQATDGSMITLYFPSSSEIKITASAWFGGHLNLDISVPGTDYPSGRGLCGTFDNDPNNDLTHRSGFVDTMPADDVPESFTESWKNNDSRSLFRILPSETGESYVPQFCTCNNDRNGTVNCAYQGDIIEHELKCPNCQDTTRKSTFTGGGWNRLKRKRSVSGNAYVDSDEIQQVYDPNDYADFRPPKLSWPTSTGIHKSEAENYCSTALRQSQLWSYCQDKSQEIQGLIENCKIDILVADDYIGTEAIVETFLTICKVDLAKNPDNYITTPSGESVVKPEISDDVCSPVCYINGRCDRGRCVCNRGFIGDNCQIKDEPPKLLGIRGSSLCDFNERPCKQLFIDAENIQNTATMACKIHEILDDMSVSERDSMEEAVFLTFNKLGCFLPDAGIRTEKSIKRFYITATIDGSRYSNAVNMTVYDSSCQSCSQEGCRQLPDTCLINKLCFQDGQLNPNDHSQVCNVSANTTEWSPVPTVRCEIAVQLLDGPNPYEGRVEILKDGVWLSVCHQYVSSNFGRVVCRQLSYPADGAVLYYANSYGPAPGEILRKYINCSGEELSLSNCSFSPSDQNCDPRYTLGVSCDTGLSEVQTVHLVNGSSQYEGRVEVFKAGVWGTVTAMRDLATRPLYSVLAANIVCRTLFGSHYSGSAVPQQEATLRFGYARSAMHMSSVRCQGDEQNLFNCTYDAVVASETPDNTLAVVCKQVPEGCSGYISAPNGTITSPGFPKGAVYSSNTDCVWTIVNKAGWIRLSLTNTQIETELDASMSLLRVIDSDAYSNLAYIQRPARESALQSSGSTLYLWLKAQSKTKGIQFQASWETPPCFQRLKRRSGYIQSPDYPNPYQPNLNCTYELVKRRGFQIGFSFKVFELGEQKDGVCQDVLQIFDGDSGSSPTLGGPLCGSTPPSVLKTRNQNSTTVLVRFMSDAISTSAEKGYRIHYYQMKPGRITLGDYTEDSGTFASPGYPGDYNGEEDVVWTITTKPYKIIALSFEDVQLGPCCRNKILVTEKPVHKRTRIVKSGSLSTIISGGKRLRVKMVSAKKNVNKFKASWTTECRQVFQTSNGIINSPDDPDFNTSSADCTYIIKQQPGYYVNIQFSSLILEEDETCKNYIEVHDGATKMSPLLGEKYCGLSLPPPLTSTHNVVLVKFSTQTGDNNFSLTYSSYPRECDQGLMTDSQGSFTSPGFPFGYPSNTYCMWTIRVNDYEAVIDLAFDDFSVGSQGSQCKNAFVRVYNSAVVDTSTVMATLCGSTLPQGLRSTGNSLTVVLNVFGSVVNATGFRATYTTTRLTGRPPEADIL